MPIHIGEINVNKTIRRWPSIGFEDKGIIIEIVWNNTHSRFHRVLLPCVFETYLPRYSISFVDSSSHKAMPSMWLEEYNATLPSRNAFHSGTVFFLISTSYVNSNYSTTWPELPVCWINTHGDHLHQVDECFPSILHCTLCHTESRRLNENPTYFIGVIPIEWCIKENSYFMQDVSDLIFKPNKMEHVWQSNRIDSYKLTRQ